jgi:hypothetical protein
LASQVAAGIKKRSLESRSCDVNPLSFIGRDWLNRGAESGTGITDRQSLFLSDKMHLSELWLWRTCLLTSREQTLLPDWNAGKPKWNRNIAHRNA